MILFVLGMMFLFPYSSQTFAFGGESDAVQG